MPATLKRPTLAEISSPAGAFLLDLSGLRTTAGTSGRMATQEVPPGSCCSAAAVTVPPTCIQLWVQGANHLSGLQVAVRIEPIGVLDTGVVAERFNPQGNLQAGEMIRRRLALWNPSPPAPIHYEKLHKEQQATLGEVV